MQREIFTMEKYFGNCAKLYVASKRKQREYIVVCTYLILPQSHCVMLVFHLGMKNHTLLLKFPHQTSVIPLFSLYLHAKL